MKIEDLQDAMGQLDDHLVTETAKARRKKNRPLRYRVGAVAAAVAVIVTSFMVIQFLRRPGDRSVSGVVALATPAYPVMHERPSEDMVDESNEDAWDAYDKAYDAWERDLEKQRNQPTGYKDGVLTLARAANKLLLTGQGENRIYSPVNIYMALSLLAETSGGDTRAEILQVLGVDTIENLRAKTDSLWNAHYIKDGHTTSVLANSIWLDKSLSVKKDVMQILQDTYKATAFQGDMGDAAMTEQLQKWLNEQTDNLLESSVDNAGFDKDTLMALASTILFRAKWSDEFNAGATAKGTFHTPSGPVDTDFLSESHTNSYYWGDKFSAVGKGLLNAGSMWFFLPDEGVSVDELLSDPQVDALLQNSSTYEQQKILTVNLKVPKFDVMSEIQLGEALQELGIHKAFSGDADFSPISDDNGLYVTDAKHAARVMIDEKGVTGAAYTLVLCGAGAPPDETVDFVLDRPFLFVVLGHDGLPLFVGVVNQP